LLPFVRGQHTTGQNVAMETFGTFTLSDPTDANGQQWALNNFLNSASRYASPAIRLLCSIFDDQKAYTAVLGMQNR
jgi:hypothetical protein